MIYVDAFGHALQDLGTPASQTPDPELAAQAAATKILTQIYAPQPDIIPQRVCITFFGLGRDLADCDGTQASGEPSRKFSDLRFFREEDRLPGMLDNDSDPQDLIFDGFPQNTTGPIDPASNRTYRLPFLINAGDPGIGQPQATSPMHEWVRKFVEEYRHLQTAVYNGTNDPRILPDPARVYLDTEPSITSAAGGRNEVFMLWWLAQPAQSQIWHERQVPGYPPGTTLQSLYAQATALTAYALPTDINNLTNGLERDNPDGAKAPRNRPFMLWWQEVCLHVQSYALKYSVYDVFHAAWPQTEPDGSFKLKCGNYDDFGVDNVSVPGNTGWFMDYQSPWAPEGQRGPRTHPSQTFPRTRIASLYQGSLMYGVGSATGGKRWLTISPYVAGEMDSPTQYFIGDSITAGTHQLPNLYRPAWQLETLRESGVRLARTTTESVLESNVSPAKRPLVPWLQEAYTTIQGDPTMPDSWRTIQPGDLEDLLLMLRAKNTPEYIFWTGYNSEPGSLDEQTLSEHAWAVTSEIAARVYAPRVYGYRPSRGSLTPDTPIAMDPSRLEFTLNGVARTVGLRSEGLGNGMSTGLLVVMSGLDPECNSQIKINIESTVDDASVTGLVQVFDNESGEWLTVPQPLEAPPRQLFRYWTPAGVDGTFQARLTCFLNPRVAPPFQRFVDPDGNLKVMITHTSSSQFISRVDLVQVVPSPGCGTIVCPPPLPTCMPPIETLKGDVDLDGLITVDDLTSFMAKWSEEAFFADINEDGVVDEVDLLKFLLAYSEGT